MQTTWYWKKIKKNKKGNLIRFEYRYVWTWGKVWIKNIRISVDRAWVLKVRVFGTRKWPIIRTDGSGQIKVYHSGLYGLNKDRAGRSPELLCVLSTRSHFTLASVARKDISWFSLGKRTLWRQRFNHILYWWGWTFCSIERRK